LKRLKKHGIFLRFAVLFVTTISLLAGCDNGSTNDDSKLGQWEGTWNSIVGYLDEDWVQQTLANGATTIGGNATADKLKDYFKARIAMGFDSCVINGDTISLYQSLDATGEQINKITFSYKEIIPTTDHGGHDGGYWAFEGNRDGYKYLIVLPPEHPSEEYPVVFHFRYGDEGFHALHTMTTWNPTMLKQGSTHEQITKWLETAISFLPQAIFDDL
jgi:zinc transport system substrate-binding protein